MPTSSRVVLYVLIAAMAACSPEGSDVEAPKDLSENRGGAVLLRNARIYTFDAGGAVIENGFMAVSAHGAILALGDNEPMAGDFADAREIDLRGNTVLPGLIDSHGHLYGLALSYTRANLVGTRSKTEVMARLRAFAAELPDGAWLLGEGWDQSDWPEQVFPTRGDLDAEFPDRPVWLTRIDGHAAWTNSPALAEADRDFSGDWQVEGGFIHRDESGEASGIFVDNAMPLVESVIPPVSPEILEAALDLATQTMVSLGLTGVHDPGIDRAALELYRSKIRVGRFPIRVYAMADGFNETLDWLCEEGPVSDPSGRLHMRSVKLYADGALGSRGAALLTDYNDDPGNLGLLFAGQEEVEANMRRVMSCGLQVGIHAIGDAANRQALNAFENLQGQFPDNPGRHRIEHVQQLHPDDLPRLAELGVIAAMQPTHATSDMYWALDRLGEDRAPGAYAWRSLLDSGACLAFGSDFPVEEVNPMHGIYAAVTRQDLQGWPEGGWLPRERISREEAVRAFTQNAAYAGFMEDEVGSIEVGKRADFIVLDRDIMTVPATEIPEVLVLETWVDGERVYRR